MYQLKKCRS